MWEITEYLINHGDTLKEELRERLLGDRIISPEIFDQAVVSELALIIGRALNRHDVRDMLDVALIETTLGKQFFHF